MRVLRYVNKLIFETRIYESIISKHSQYVGGVPPVGGLPKASIDVVPFLQSIYGCLGFPMPVFRRQVWCRWGGEPKGTPVQDEKSG